MNFRSGDDLADRHLSSLLTACPVQSSYNACTWLEDSGQPSNIEPRSLTLRGTTTFQSSGPLCQQAWGMYMSNAWDIDQDSSLEPSVPMVQGPIFTLATVRRSGAPAFYWVPKPLGGLVAREGFGL